MAETAGPVPPWASEPLRRLIDDIDRLEKVVHLSGMGISMVANSHELVQVLDEQSETQDPERVEWSARMAKLASREVQDGFPLLFRQGVVTLWALLEAGVKNVVVSWITNKPECLRGERFQKVKISVAEYESLSALDRAYYILGLLEREEGATLKTGVERFERLLDSVGLGGAGTKNLTQALLELSQVRNMIVHAGTRVDSKFAKMCPWLKVSVGTEYLVTKRHFDYYHAAGVAYVGGILIPRIRKAFGMKMPKRDHFLADFDRYYERHRQRAEEPA